MDKIQRAIEAREALLASLRSQRELRGNIFGGMFDGKARTEAALDVNRATRDYREALHAVDNTIGADVVSEEVARTTAEGKRVLNPTENAREATARQYGRMYGDGAANAVRNPGSAAAPRTTIEAEAPRQPLSAEPRTAALARAEMRAAQATPANMNADQGLKAMDRRAALIPEPVRPAVVPPAVERAPVQPAPNVQAVLDRVRAIPAADLAPRPVPVPLDAHVRAAADEAARRAALPVVQHNAHMVDWHNEGTRQIKELWPPRPVAAPDVAPQVRPAASPAIAATAADARMGDSIRILRAAAADPSRAPALLAEMDARPPLAEPVRSAAPAPQPVRAPAAPRVPAAPLSAPLGLAAATDAAARRSFGELQSVVDDAARPSPRVEMPARPVFGLRHAGGELATAESVAERVERPAATTRAPRTGPGPMAPVPQRYIAAHDRLFRAAVDATGPNDPAFRAADQQFKATMREVLHPNYAELPQAERAAIDTKLSGAVRETFADGQATRRQSRSLTGEVRAERITAESVESRARAASARTLPPSLKIFEHDPAVLERVRVAGTSGVMPHGLPPMREAAARVAETHGPVRAPRDGRQAALLGIAGVVTAVAAYAGLREDEWPGTIAIADAEGKPLNARVLGINEIARGLSEGRETPITGRRIQEILSDIPLPTDGSPYPQAVYARLYVQAKNAPNAQARAEYEAAIAALRNDQFIRVAQAEGKTSMGTYGSANAVKENSADYVHNAEIYARQQGLILENGNVTVAGQVAVAREHSLRTVTAGLAAADISVNAAAVQDIIKDFRPPYTDAMYVDIYRRGQAAGPDMQNNYAAAIGVLNYEQQIHTARAAGRPTPTLAAGEPAFAFVTSYVAKAKNDAAATAGADRTAGNAEAPAARDPQSPAASSGRPAAAGDARPPAADGQQPPATDTAGNGEQSPASTPAGGRVFGAQGYEAKQGDTMFLIASDPAQAEALAKVKAVLGEGASDRDAKLALALIIARENGLASVNNLPRGKVLAMPSDDQLRAGAEVIRVGSIFTNETVAGSNRITWNGEIKSSAIADIFVAPVAPAPQQPPSTPTPQAPVVSPQPATPVTDPQDTAGPEGAPPPVVPQTPDQVRESPNTFH